MALRRHHYERAFEDFLRSHRTPYVAVDEARKALVPRTAAEGGVGGAGIVRDDSPDSLKSFDFVIYSPRGPNLLADVKGRKVARRAGAAPLASGHLQSWVTEDDIASLTQWQALFGRQFAAAFIFVYWCDQQPPDALFQEVFEHHGRWYALRCVRLDDYARAMKPRSTRWRTVHVPAAAFERISHPFTPCHRSRGRPDFDATTSSHEPLHAPPPLVGSPA